MQTSYPTRSLRFLERVPQHSTDAAADGVVSAKVPLNIIVAGAGLGGLATAIALAVKGHTVRSFDQVSKLGEVGAGIQVPPNSTRLLHKWGVGKYLGGNVVESENIFFRRWEDGAVIGDTKLKPDFRDNFGAPYYVVHRAHLHSALHKRAVELGVEVNVNSKVVDYDLDTPSVTLEDGSTHTADLVVAADGVKSMARKLILGGQDQLPQRTGNAAYRATVHTDMMKADPDLAWLLEKPAQNCWIGHDQHVMSYSIAGGKSWNMVLSHPESSDPSTWKQETALADMKRQFEGWDPRLTKIINMVETTLKWPLLSGTPLPHWVAGSGKALILGDAAHAMVPYMSQGAAMAVEDAGALAVAVSLIPTKDGLPAALRVFERVRIKRTAQMQEASLVNGKIWHYADGPEQRARDDAMRPEVEGRHFVESPNQWSDPVTQDWCYGHDAERAMEEAWGEYVREERRKEGGSLTGAAWL